MFREAEKSCEGVMKGASFNVSLWASIDRLFCNYNPSLIWLDWSSTVVFRLPLNLLFFVELFIVRSCISFIFLNESPLFCP